MRQPLPLASIVILTCNRLDWTRRCLASIQAHTTTPYELILVDNGSTDGTSAFLRRLASGSSVPEGDWRCRCSCRRTCRPRRVRLVLNRANRGYAAGCNQGIRAARGASVVLLNNDTLVPPAWLARLARCARHGRKIGAVGPASNGVRNGQYRPFGPGRLDRFCGFSRRIRSKRRGRSSPVPFLTGFCLYIPRRVLAAVGLLDTRFFPGGFEDHDWSLRLLAAGYRSVCAQDVFVYHRRHATWRDRRNRLDRRTALGRNGRRFLAKWRRDPLLALYLADCRRQPPLVR